MSKRVRDISRGFYDLYVSLRDAFKGFTLPAPSMLLFQDSWQYSGVKGYSGFMASGEGTVTAKTKGSSQSVRYEDNTFGAFASSLANEISAFARNLELGVMSIAEIGKFNEKTVKNEKGEETKDYELSSGQRIQALGGLLGKNIEISTSGSSMSFSSDINIDTTTWGSTYTRGSASAMSGTIWVRTLEKDKPGSLDLSAQVVRELVNWGTAKPSGIGYASVFARWERGNVEMRGSAEAQVSGGTG